MNVLAGDFNASICMVVPKLRDRGIMIELAAGPYMFRSLGGEPQMDTCAIFFVGCPGQYARCVEMQHFHDQHAGGVLFQDASVIGADPPYINRTPSAVAEGGVKPLSLHRHDSNKFPGNPHKVFQPRETGAAERLAWLFLPERASEEAIAKRDADRRKREEAEKRRQVFVSNPCDVYLPVQGNQIGCRACGVGWAVAWWSTLPTDVRHKFRLCTRPAGPIQQECQEGREETGEAARGVRLRC